MSQVEYQPRKNVLISSEFGEPNAYESGFDIEDVGAGRYRRLLGTAPTTTG